MNSNAQKNVDCEALFSICSWRSILRPCQRHSDFKFYTFPMINEIGLLRTSLYTKMKYFLQSVEKIRTGLQGNLRYFRFHF